MVQIISLAIIFLWLVFAAKQILHILHWLQIREYRLDRFYLLLKSMSGLMTLDVHKWFLFSLGVSLAVIFKSMPTVIAILFVFLLIIAKDVFSRYIRRPKLTLRMMLVVAIAFALLFAVSIVLYSQYLVLNIGLESSLFILHISVLVIPLIAMAITYPLSKYLKIRTIFQAKSLIEQIKPVVIGITGSYGKSTTKEFLYTILSSSKKTIKTVANENTEIGVARAVVNNLKNGVEYFVVEAGAYKRGEIKVICDIVRPSIAIITGIEKQHLALFGSLEDIKRAKYELVESLPKCGIVVFNYSNSQCREMAQWAKASKKQLKVYSYSMSKEADADMVSEIITLQAKSIKFKISFAKETQMLEAPIVGNHYVENLTGAILVARQLNISWQDISKAVKMLELPKSALKLQKAGNGLVINDSYNSSPKSFEVALDYLSGLEQKPKLVVTSGIIELGSETKNIHSQIGKKMTNMVDWLIVTDRENYKYLKVGYERASTVNFSKDVKLIKKKIAETTSQGGVVLIEGRVPAGII